MANLMRSWQKDCAFPSVFDRLARGPRLRQKILILDEIPQAFKIWRNCSEEIKEENHQLTQYFNLFFFNVFNSFKEEEEEMVFPVPNKDMMIQMKCIPV